MNFRIVIFALLLLCVAGCTIPVVGNSPEEVKHRKQLQEGQR